MIQFNADKIRVSGPKIDGSYTVTFEIGEYEQLKVAELLAVPQQTNVKVRVEESNTDTV